MSDKDYGTSKDWRSECAWSWFGACCKNFLHPVRREVCGFENEVLMAEGKWTLLIVAVNIAIAGNLVPVFGPCDRARREFYIPARHVDGIFGLLLLHIFIADCKVNIARLG
jgi:hypothetical protein